MEFEQMLLHEAILKSNPGDEIQGKGLKFIMVDSGVLHYKDNPKEKATLMKHDFKNKEWIIIPAEPDDLPKEKIIKSSNIYKIKWDKNNLWVQYNNGGVYQYKDIPEEVSIGLGEAEHAGSFLAREIKGKYRFEQMH